MSRARLLAQRAAANVSTALKKTHFSGPDVATQILFILVRQQMAFRAALQHMQDVSVSNNQNLFIFSHLSAALSDTRWHADQCEKSLKAAVALSIAQSLSVAISLDPCSIWYTKESNDNHGHALIAVSCYPLLHRTINVSV